MKNKEKFKDEILKIALEHEAAGVSKDGKVYSCNYLMYQDEWGNGECNCIFEGSGWCTTAFKEWLEQEYVERKDYEGALLRLSSIDLDFVLDKLGYKDADKVSDYGICDYPNLEMQKDLDCIAELVKKSTPTKPKGLSVTHEGKVGNCAYCGKFITNHEPKANICECGQVQDWGDRKNDDCLCELIESVELED